MVGEKLAICKQSSLARRSASAISTQNSERNGFAEPAGLEKVLSGGTSLTCTKRITCKTEFLSWLTHAPRQVGFS